MESSDALVEEKKLMNEAKYRNYMSNIDKALKNFEYSSEWADLISALGKLCKAISSNTQYQIIPRRIKISKRLSQCMHPALPSGVHLKALETYDVIFSKTGPERLATELFIYSAGLFPLLGYAAMNVRPALLQIYEKYFVPLGEKLRPALSGFLSGVLPGYEAGLDHFERTNSLLTLICSAVNPIYFYTVFWESVATNAAIRLPAISFLVDHFNRRSGMEDQIFIMGHNHDVMMSGLCACLNDSVILVQRNTLEFLLLGFPMHTNYLIEADFIKLITNGLNTILRRDMSLNRRLYSWLLGTEVKKIRQQYSGDDSTVEEKSETYFEKHSRHVLIEALVCIFKFSLESDPVDLKPYRIMVSLLDKAEIGPPVLDYVLSDIIRTMSLCNGNLEVTKAANLLFATFDPSYIWSFMTIMFEKACKMIKGTSKLTKNLRNLSQADEQFTNNRQKYKCIVGSGDPCLIEICYLTEFLLETISLEMYNETTRIYLPKVFLAITQLLTKHSENLTNEEVTSSLKLLMKIVSRVQPMITPVKPTASLKFNGNDDSSVKSQTQNNSINNKQKTASQVSDNLPNGNNTLEKSKSDSKLNQFSHTDNDDEDETEIRRSNSNHFIERKNGSNSNSPKKQINNRSNKKAKSYSKLLELDKEINSDTGQFILPSSSSELDTPQSIKKLKLKKASPKLLKTSPKKSRPKDLKVGNKKLDYSLEDDLSLDTPTILSTTEFEELNELRTSSPPPPTTTTEFRSPTFHEYTLLEKCIRQYEIFYEIYLSRKILQISNLPKIINCSVTVKIHNEEDDITTKKNFENIFENETVFNDENTERISEIQKLFETLKINVICRLTQLKSLLNRSLNNNVESASDISDIEYKDCISSTERLDKSIDKKENKIKIFDENVEKSVMQLMNLKICESLRTSIKLASNLLVEMSTFPNCNKNLVLDKAEIELPIWLKVLSLVSCYTQSDKELQLAAIATLFDLISLLKSQIEHATSPGVNFVVMIPVMKFGHVSFIESKTRIFQLVTSILWNYLGDNNVDPGQISLLLYQLHNCLESGLVEAVISSRMLSEFHLNDESVTIMKSILEGKSKTVLSNYKMEKLNEMKMMCISPTATSLDLVESEAKGFKKFELLWHLGRDKKPQRGFDKTLLRMLDTLGLPIYVSTRTFVTKWLQESLLRGDLQRLIKPLNKILFSSKSKRIGIIHVHLLKNQLLDDVDLDLEDSDQKNDHGVYAISSEFGNVKYHIEQQKKRSPIRSLQKKFFGVTIGNKNKTSNFVSDTKLNTPSETDSNIGLIINPLESDFDSMETTTTTISTSAPNKIETTVASTSPIPLKKIYSSSSDESDTESLSCSRETSVEKEFSTGTLIKRFSGDCERVTEVLSEHDRTKNRKTYRLNQARENKTLKSAVSVDSGSSIIEKLETQLTEISEGQFDDNTTTAHTAEEYFSSSAENEQHVENFVQNLFDKVCDDEKHAEIIIDSRTENKSIKSTSSFNSDKKRASCISKTSTDSNLSSKDPQSLHRQQQQPSDSYYSDDTEVFSESEIENKRRSLSLETQNTKIFDWELTEKTMQKGKENVEILRKNVAEATKNKKILRRKISEERKKHYDKLHPFHTHMLLYFGVYDTEQALYAFQTLRNIIAADTRTFLCLSITTSISSNTVKQLLVRHRKSIFGKGFTGTITNTEFSQAYRGCMYLEVLFTCCLYYSRSYFYKELSEGNDFPNSNDIIGNCKVQLESVELLTLICTELIEIVKGMGKGLACYIADLFSKCKLQKIILHCLNSSVLAFSKTKQQKESLSEQILNFNQAQDENLHLESVQIQLLRLLMAIIKLEHEVVLLKNDESNNKQDNNGGSASNSPTRLSPNTIVNVKYLPNCPISQQPMFLAAVLSALQCEDLQHLHRNWTDLVTSSLNCFNFGSLTNIVISVVHQICNNLDRIAKLNLKEHCNFPPDYVVSQLEAVTVLCHYCLLDNSQQTTLSHLFNQAYPQTSVAVQSSNTGQLLNNIVHTFLSSQSVNEHQQPKNSAQQAARNAVLSHLPRIVASVAAVWDSELVQFRQVKQQLMEFLSPISLHHGVNFLAAVAVTWQDRNEFNKDNTRKLSISEQYIKNCQPQATSEQISLVKLVSSIRVMPMDSFVSTLHQVVKSPPPIHRPPAGLTLEVSALELFYFYLKSAPAPQLGDSWSSLLALIRDGLALSPPAQFVLLMLLNEFVQRCPQLPFQDKKDIRDLHDVTARLVEALSQVAGAGLEQTTWLRRNLAVKEDISPATPDGSLKDLTQQYCVQAQCVLAAILANLLDVGYGSQEKDKVVNIVITLMYNITPYLKNHTTRNIPSFYACSSLLASLSSYQYTRKAWRKDMLDLLLDNSFFQMDFSCLPFWKQIMDSLMTYDNTTFRELMSRVSLTQTGGLNLFTSREQEYEQRALLLKRLAFVLFCSELDQYHKYMPEIQEQLVNSLRLPSVVPSVQAAVFLCFRVLLLRMSPDNVTSLWPIIIAEMVQVFLAIEQELKSDSEELSQHIRLLSGMDVPWAMSGNGMNSQIHLTHWRAVQLEASKLLELGCVLPATNLPHFQMYRWAFVGTEFDAPQEKKLPNGNLDLLDSQNYSGTYVPHVRRIARLMDMKYAVHSSKIELKRGNHLVLTCQQISNLQDLYTFFSTLSVTCPTPHNFADTGKEVASCLNEIEEILSKDFLEKMPTTSR